MKKIKITFEHKQIEVEENTTYLEISKYSLKKDTALAVKKNNELFPLTARATNDEVIEFIDSSSIEGSKMYKAAIKFILEVALKTVFPKSDIDYLHSVPGGMLGEIEYERVLSKEDISKIKEEMAKIIDENCEFKRYNILKKEAIDFYEATSYYEKAMNVKTCDDIVTIYKLKDHLNYFYVPMPYSTGYIKQFELKYLGQNRLIILYPSNLTEGRLPEYVHHENIINAYYEGKSWLKRLNAPYVADLNNLVANRKMKDFIESCELHFTDEIKKACDKIIRNNDKKFVMIAGPSSSGKTTTTRILGAYLRSKGYDPICLSTDDYFVDREDTPKDVPKTLS